jgi:hypothetical protein
MADDKIQIEILEDGTIKVITDPISGPNHVSAEAFLRQMAQLAGGTTTRERRKDVHRHDHGHTHTHSHDHSH